MEARPPGQPIRSPLTSTSHSRSIQRTSSTSRTSSSRSTNQLKNPNKKVVTSIQAPTDRQSNNSKSKTPDLVTTERLDCSKDNHLKHQDKPEKKSRKRNSVDESNIHDYSKRYEAGEKSANLNKLSQSLHIRKSSTKFKRHSETVTKKKHNKTTSKIQPESTGIKQVLGTDPKHKNLKSIINRIITNELSKKSLPIDLPTQQNKTSRKKKLLKKKQLHQGRSEHLIRGHDLDQQLQSINRKMIIQKLSSLRSMNNSIFKSQQDEQIRPRQRRTIIINTDHSIDCIDQIHEIQKQAKRDREKYSKNSKKDMLEEKEKSMDTRNLIQHYLAILNQEVQLEGELVGEKEEITIQQEFQMYRNQYRKPQTPSSHHSQFQRSQDLYGSQHPSDRPTTKKQEKKQQKQKQKGMIRPFCSSQMTKQQKMINEIERVKLNQLKKHEVEKWGQLLTFIKKSMSQGKANHDEILQSIYRFLEQTKTDLQKQISKDQDKSRTKQKDVLDQFTNQFSSAYYHKEVQQDEVFLPMENLPLNLNEGAERQDYDDEDKSFRENMSSMSYKDQDYQEENQELKLMNLEMIQNALKARHESLVEKRDREISGLEDKRIQGKISESQFLAQKQKLQKWTKKQTSSIMQARKNIWKGYNDAKGIIEKSLKSKYFQEQSAKKKTMMKCLSQNYLLKNYNYKKLLQKKEQQEEDQQSESLNSSVKVKEKSVHHEEQSQEKSQHSESRSHSHSHSRSLSRSRSHSKSSSSDCNINDIDSPERQINRHEENIHNQFKNLGQEADIERIKERLLDIKKNHLIEDQPQSSEQKIISNDDISYEEVDNQLQDSISENEMKLINQELNKEGKLPQPNYEKLKHVLPEDKEDIFQFIFLDLSIEMYQEPCHDNRIMDSINKYVAYMKRQATKKRGVKTNLNIVKEYLKRFLGFILRVHKNILATLDQPVGPTALQMLRYMHENEDDPVQCEEPPSPLVIPTSVFDAFEKLHLPAIQFETYYEHDEEKEAKRIQFLKNILHIHNKALFDAMNEYLDLLRPFGIWGKPFPWKNSSSFFHLTSQQQKQEKLKKASDKVAEYCSYVCGLLVDKEESLVGNARLSEDYIEQIKQDRLSRMLATELVENQERWLFYDDEETQVLVEISNAVYLIMLKEAALDAFQIIKNRKH